MFRIFASVDRDQTLLSHDREWGGLDLKPRPDIFRYRDKCKVNPRIETSITDSGIGGYLSLQIALGQESLFKVPVPDMISGQQVRSAKVSNPRSHAHYFAAV